MSSSYEYSTTAETVVADLATHIANKVILVTGVSPGGLGAEFLQQVAKSPCPPKLLILASRTPSKIQTTADALASSGVPTRALTLDLESLAAVREAAATVNAWADVPHIDVLVNNAGIMAVPYAKTVDGFERTFAVNHLAHFLFTNLLVPKLLKAPSGARVVSVSSDGHRLSWIRSTDVGFQDGKLYNQWTAYGQSKTANILFAVSLAHKLGTAGITAVSLNPGGIQTNIGVHLEWNTAIPQLIRLDQDLGNAEGFRDFGVKTLSQGVATYVYGAFEPSLKEHNGAYLQDSRIADPYAQTIKAHAVDKVEADKLWALSEDLVGEKFAY